MATTTPKGIPKPEMSDPPNGPDQIGAVADWIDDTLTGTTGQLFRANTATASDVEWAWPRARTVTSAASVGSPSKGDLVVEDANGGRLLWWDTIQWRPSGPDISSLPKGFIDSNGGAAVGVTDTNIATVTATLQAGRKYRLIGYALATPPSVDYTLQVAAQILRGDGVEVVRFPDSPLRRVASPVQGERSWDGSGPTTFNLRVWKIDGDAPNFTITTSWLELYDVGVA